MLVLLLSVLFSQQVDENSLVDKTQVLACNFNGSLKYVGFCATPVDLLHRARTEPCSRACQPIVLQWTTRVRRSNVCYLKTPMKLQVAFLLILLLLAYWRFPHQIFAHRKESVTPHCD